MATDAALPPLVVGVLGPLHMAVDGAAVEIPGVKRRAVLALLALAAGRAVTVDDLIDALWPGEPPKGARSALHSHISRLRGHLSPHAERLQAVEGGYRLQLRDDELDATRARSLFDEAAPLVRSDPATAAGLLRQARSLWRGRPLAELGDVDAVAARALDLGELRRRIDDLLVEAAVAAGDAASVVGVAAEAVAEEPLRERGVLLLVEALAGAGQATDALRAAHDFRRRLRDESGLDPSHRLAELELAVAAGGGLAAAPPPAPSLPAPATSLVGRRSEVAAVGRLLDSDRIVTVVGPGGVGKTRLAIEVARRRDDVRFLALASVGEAGALPHALASALHLETASGDVLAACLALLGAGPQLLVVDNCEHLLAAARDLVGTLVESCPALTVLATSREPLGLPGECQVRLGPLPVSGPATGSAEQSPAVGVFLDRARRARPGFAPGPADMELIGDLVRRLDGLPLAIELAAGRLSSLGLADLHARLDRSLDLLSGGRATPDARHETLRSTLAWSYDLLPAAEQRLFGHIAVFPDGVDLATAEWVAAAARVPGEPASLVGHLVDASMLDAELGPDPRYRMLETVRAFAVDRLELDGAAEDAEAHLVGWAVDFVHWIDAHVNSEREALANRRLRRELPNLRAAWHAARRRRDLDAAVEMIVALYEACTWRDLPEVWEWASELAADTDLGGHPRAAAALAAGSDCAWMQGDVVRARDLAERALAVANDDDGRSRAMSARSIVALADGDYGAAVRHGLAAGATPAVHAWLVAALAAAYGGDLDRARAISDQAPAPSPTLQAEKAYVAGECASIAGRYEEAQEHYRRAIELGRSVEATFAIGVASVGLVANQAHAGHTREALEGYRELIRYWEHAGNWVQMWTTLRNLAVLLRKVGDGERAARLEAAADHADDAPVVARGVWPDERLPQGEESTDADGRGDGGDGGGKVVRLEVVALARQAIDDALGRIAAEVAPSA